VWREVKKNKWVWVNECTLNGERDVSIMVKPGGVYAIYYHGDKTHPPQFVGSILETEGNIKVVEKGSTVKAAQFTAPPKEVTKVKVNSSGWVTLDLIRAS
jgi:hypothetical protein